jgi:cytochrome b561
MAAQAERQLNSSAHGCFRTRMLAALTGCFALLTVVIGVLGLLGASWPRRILESWINIHALFGLLLCALVLARCRWCVKHSPPMLPPEVRQLARHLSRIVYFLLYAVIAVREIIGILNSVCHGGRIDFNLFDERFLNGPDYAGFNPKDDFQLYLASGLITLIFVRVLAFRLWLRSVERAALSKAATEGMQSPSPKESRENADR